MRAIDIIRTKRDGRVLTREALDAFVQGVTDGTWPDYQISAFLMAVFLRGMTLDEATALTQAMVESGERLDCSDLIGPGNGSTTVDKHSTGGVGDKTSLILAPLAAACGALVPMMSGRGLGHTGGTLDKLAAIPGFRTNLSVPKMRKALADVGCVLIQQTAEVAPADKRMYALRDATGTVESIPLIASSILSKKVTEGIGALVMDVKVGSGAFMQDLSHARELAAWLVGIAERSGLRTEALLTRMDTPLGRRVGNASEVLESIQTLRGEGPEDLEFLSVTLAARMLVLGGVAPAEDAERRVRDALESGRGLEKFRQIIAAQGGDPRVIDDPALLPLADRESLVRAPRTGVVTKIDAGAIGRAAVALGAGRDHMDATVDPGVGIDLLLPEGTPVVEGDPVLRLYYRDTARLDAALVRLRDAIAIGGDAAPPAPVIIERLDRDSAAVVAL
jgi:pyrimidine-nucleoside phosphorylase